MTFQVKRLIAVAAHLGVSRESGFSVILPGVLKFDDLKPDNFALCYCFGRLMQVGQGQSALMSVFRACQWRRTGMGRWDRRYRQRVRSLHGWWCKRNRPCTCGLLLVIVSVPAPSI